MKLQNLDCPLGSNPLQAPSQALPLVRASATRIACLIHFKGRASLAPPLIEEGSQQRCGVPTSIPLAGTRGGWEGFGSRQYLTKITITIVLLACITPTAQAANLGRLFFTPEQRAHLDYTYARNAPLEGNSSPVLTVNGIVQKNGGARTVWVNGVSQDAGKSGERTPTAQTVTIPGKSQPVKIKVGDRILLDHSAPPGQPAPAD